MYKYFTLDNFEFKEKVVGVRVDINSPIIDNKVVLNERITQSAVTLKELSEKGAKVIVIAHQGRAGKPDCVSLKEHAILLSKEIGKKVDFISEVYSKNVEDKINLLKSGDILLLENLRFSKDEEDIKKKDNAILKLQSLFDFYVFDAFSVSHREQTSVVGFTKIPNIAGRLMERELLGLNKLTETKSPHMFIFGGAKPDDLVELLEADLKLGKVDQILLSGVIGEIALYIKGAYLGKKYDFLKSHDFLGSVDRIKLLMEKYSDKFLIPKDVAVFDGNKRVEISFADMKKGNDLLDKFLINDIGSQTVTFYSSVMKSAGSIYFKGPAGNFEEKGLEVGTNGLIKAMVESKSFVFMGGGHSVTAVQKLNLLEKFSYVSLAGGALVVFLSGKKLPGVVTLEKSHDRFEKLYEDFVVLGSNTVDMSISTTKNFNEIHLGDKVRIDDDIRTTIGGGGVNVAVCLSRLGAKVGYLGKLSYENVDKIKDLFIKTKINLVESKVSKRPVAKSIVVDTKDEDRVIFTYRGQNEFLELHDFNVNGFRSSNFYFNSLGGISFLTQIELAKILKKKNKNSIICYNPSSYLIKSEPKIRDLVKQTDILILNYEEAEEFTKLTGVSNCLKKLKESVSKIVVITDGANGSYAYDGENEFFSPAVIPKKVIDTTGAGDSFAATFFYFYVKGYGTKKSMEYASINASANIEVKGSQDGMLTYTDLIKSK